MKKTIECRRIDLFCDFHGHSQQKDIFMYGCNSASGKEHLLPMLLGKNCSFFNYQRCYFNVERPRESTARVVVNREFNVSNSYTCEASFCGPSIGKFFGFHFSPLAYQVV